MPREDEARGIGSENAASLRFRRSICEVAELGVPRQATDEVLILIPPKPNEPCRLVQTGTGNCFSYWEITI